MVCLVALACLVVAVHQPGRRHDHRGVAHPPDRRQPVAPPAGGPAGALVVGRQVAALWWSTPTRGAPQLGGRLAGLVTPGLASRLAAPAASPVLDGAGAGVRVVATAAVPDGGSATGVGVDATATVSVASPGLAPRRVVLGLELLVVPTPAGWRVAEVRQ